MRVIKFSFFILMICLLLILFFLNFDGTILLELPEPTESTVGEKDNEFIYIWTDEETGVQYIIYREKFMNAGFGGITPRLDIDGNLYLVDSSTEPTS